jgi:Uma2 family endonuclease
MKLSDSGREPDLIFVSTANLDRAKDTYLDGPADLVVEIISPESVGRDRGEKFLEYEAGGVPDYWLIDPQRQWAEFYRLEEGRYRLLHAGTEGIVRPHTIPDFWLRVEWLWQQPMPRIVDVLRELGIS